MRDIFKEVNDIYYHDITAFTLSSDVIFPNMTACFEFENNEFAEVMRNSFMEDKMILIVTPFSADVEGNFSDLRKCYNTGVVCQVNNITQTNSDKERWSVVITGCHKVEITALCKDKKGVLHGEIKRYEPVKNERNYSKNYKTAIVRRLKELFNEYCMLREFPPFDALEKVAKSRSAEKIFYLVLGNVELSIAVKRKIFELDNLYDMIDELINAVDNENLVGRCLTEIRSRTTHGVEDAKRRMFLHEQMNAISQMLGEDGGDDDEIKKYQMRIDELDADEVVIEKLNKELSRLKRMNMGSKDTDVIRDYLDVCLELKWRGKENSKVNIKKVEKILNRDHYGINKVKDRILENLAVKQLDAGAKSQIMCLYGPPGVGKTSIVKSIAEALGRKYERISLGGMRDEAEIRGHRKTYVGSMPGRIIEAMRDAKTHNPVILLDEIDKVSTGNQGDLSSALLEVLDPEQNKNFRDHYVELDFDLSDVMFITTANDLETISAPLRDRMEIIEVKSYTEEEKFQIAKRHLVPKQIGLNGLNKKQINITESAIRSLICDYTAEAGVRTLERRIASLCRKAAKEIVENNAEKVTFKKDNLEKYLGKKVNRNDFKTEKDEIGCVNGLAWTMAGGVIMPLEVLVMDGKGKLELTGSLGDVMKESAKIAVSYARSVANNYGVNAEFFEKNDIHIHAPEGAVPKDGPSAGVTLVTGIISAMAKIPVRNDVAMTGEITLRGKVLAIGGLREKTLAAYKQGIKTIVVPYANKVDMDEVEQVVKDNVEFVFAKEISDVLQVALVNNPKKAEV